MLGIQQVNPGALCEEYMGLTSISRYKMNTEPMLIRPIEKKAKGSSKCMKIVSLNWLSWTWKVFSPLLPRNGGNNVAIG